jgi:hypothetical protein
MHQIFLEGVNRKFFSRIAEQIFRLFSHLVKISNTKKKGLIIEQNDRRFIKVFRIYENLNLYVLN